LIPDARSSLHCSSSDAVEDGDQNLPLKKEINIAAGNDIRYAFFGRKII